MMKLVKLLCAAFLFALTNYAVASAISIRMTDYALPGHLSQVELVGYGASCNAYYSLSLDPQPCGFGAQPYNISNVFSTDKSLVFSLDIFGPFTYLAPGGYDYYVTFRETGSNPALVDDVLRVQFNPNASNSQLTISLISGSLVTNYLNNLPPTAIARGSFVNDVNQVMSAGSSSDTQGVDIFVGSDRFHSTGIGDPFLFEFDPDPGVPLLGLFVQPTAVLEPWPFALIGIGGIMIGALRYSRSRRRH